MMMPAMLLVAILGPSPHATGPLVSAVQPTGLSGATMQDPAPAPSPRARRRAAPPAPTAESLAGLSAEDAIQAGLDSFRKRRFTQARAAFERAVEADPQSAAAHFYLGYTIYKIAEPKRHDSPGKQEAAQHFARAYELDPGFKPVWGGRRG
jgi:tetratricopeptide (TPR) repeat protein